MNSDTLCDLCEAGESISVSPRNLWLDCIEGRLGGNSDREEMYCSPVPLEVMRYASIMFANNHGQSKFFRFSDIRTHNAL